jgi:hypothetical protein
VKNGLGWRRASWELGEATEDAPAVVPNPRVAALRAHAEAVCSETFPRYADESRGSEDAGGAGHEVRCRL